MRRLDLQGLEIEWPEAGVVLRDLAGRRLPYPFGTRRVYFKREHARIKMAFSRHTRAFQEAPAFSGLQLQAADDLPQPFKIFIPEFGFARAYEAQSIEISLKYETISVITRLPMELYLSRVLPSEMDSARFPLEALKAQAVVARTWALMNRSRHRRFGYNFCDTPHCQAYGGCRFAAANSEQAVRMTAGEVVTYQRKLAEAFYHSTCGGNTAWLEDVWAVPPVSYLRRVEDHEQPGDAPYCRASPFARWRVQCSLYRLERIFQKAGLLTPDENLESVGIDFLNRSGQVEWLEIVTSRRSVRVRSREFRRLVNEDFGGRKKMLSDFYELDRDDDLIMVEGRGLGHGVGLCQWGARGMAERGKKYREILAHYFPGTVIGKDGSKR